MFRRQDWRFYEGTTSADSILQDLGKVLSTAVKDDTGKVVQERNWDVVYPGVDKTVRDYMAPADERNLSDAEFNYKIENQLAQVTDKIILKTTTTPVEIKEEHVDDLGIESDLNAESVTTYVEIYKPQYLADPERYSPETERIGKLPVMKTYDMEKANTNEPVATPEKEILIRNNHYVYVRAFDEIDMTIERGVVLDARPKDETNDEFTGHLVETHAHTSEWAKLSWYRDFDEVYVDEHDDEIGDNQISKGVEFTPLVTAGINGSTRIRFWINTNNDRTVLVLMGNPSLDLSNERHLISFCYLGKIDSFDGSINDTAGNFALTTSSSTYPYKTVQDVISTEFTDPVEARSNIPVGTGDGNRNKWFIDLRNSYIPGTEQVTIDGVPAASGSYRISYNLLEFLRPPAEGVSIGFRASFIVPELEEQAGAIRDEFGNVVRTYSPDKFGRNTATCVTDIAMYHTRSKAYWQRHLPMFNSTEEYMTKEMYGKSAYTNEYYADKVKITHGNDGPRGLLNGCLVIDRSSLVPLDDLVQNRDFEKDAREDEETYVYFPITAPYSMLTSGPSSLNGIALLKEVKRPEPATDLEAAERVADSIYIGNIRAITNDFVVPLAGAYNSTITWVPSHPIDLVINDETGEVTVTRPGEEEDPKPVTLTATINVAGETVEKVFECVILPEGMSDGQAIINDRNWLIDYFDGEDMGELSGEVMLPLEGPNETEIEWTTIEEDVIEIY